MGTPTTFAKVREKLSARPLVYWLLWGLTGLAILWFSSGRQWSSSRLVSQAVQHWEQELPLILEQVEKWKQSQETTDSHEEGQARSDWDEVSWDLGGCRVQWKGNDLTSRDDKVLQNLKEDGWVKVASGSGLAFVKDSPRGRRVAFVRLEYRYGLNTETLPFGMMLPFDGGDQLRVVSPGHPPQGQPVRCQGKVWFRVQATGRLPVSQQAQQKIFHALTGIWLLLWALLIYWYRPNLRFAVSMLVLGFGAGNLWLWNSDLGGSRFFEPVYVWGWRAWSQAGILFNVLWISLSLLVLGLRLGSWGRWMAWGGLYLAWALILDAGLVKIGWANPVTWSLDDGAWVLALLLIMVLASNVMREGAEHQGQSQGLWGLVSLTLLGMLAVVLWGFQSGWTLWGWVLGLGYTGWMGLGWCWKRFVSHPIGLNVVLGLMGLFCSVLIYAQHWRIQVSSAQGQLATLVEPRPLEAYTYFYPFIDSLRGDAAWMDSSSRSMVELSRSILDKHYSNLSPFFDLLSSEYIPNTQDSVQDRESGNPDLVTAWKGSVQEFQTKGRNEYRLRIALGFNKPVPDTLVVILAQKFFPSFSPIPSILGTGTTWSTLIGRSGLALYEKGDLIFQSGPYPYPYRLPQRWSATNQRTPWSWVYGEDGRPALIFCKEQKQVAVQVLDMPSILMPLSLGALMTMVMWWFLRLPRRNSMDNLRAAMQWKSFRFQTKVQWATTFLVILVISALVGFTLYFITRQHRNESKASMVAQLRQFHLMAQGLVSVEGDLTDKVVRAMRDRAALNDIDFFLYDMDGRYRSGSRGLWFERALVSDYMPCALWKSFGQGQFQFQLIEERIGQVDYLSAYHALRNADGRLIGFVNLPFVNKAPRGAPELSEYLAGVISVFTLVLLVSILLAYRVAKGVASPIQVLTKAMLQAKAGRKITLDDQMSGGEFGLLLKSYNQMVQSLSENEKRLAEAERDSAWKEMARQIAHDIKNPLTPMKLRLQKLLRDYKGNPEAFDSKFESDAQSVLQQIDLLTEIADTYRDFSRESEADKSPILWSEFVQEVAGWYAEQVVWEWCLASQAETVLVQGNTSRLQRVLQNLFQNAIQAKPVTMDKAEVSLRMDLVRDEIVLEMVDQGSGISEEMQGRLFELNFTTRSEGLGLGLAMSRKVVEQHGGSLGLEYSDERGTAFRWAMPVYALNSERRVS